MARRIIEMDIRRFYTQASPIDGTFRLLEDYNHIVRVLRYKVGYKLIVCNGDGLDYACSITEITRDEVVVRIDDSTPNASVPRVRIHLYPAILKRDKFDLVVQKAVELGVSEITPIVTERCVDRDVGIERLERIVTDAAKQCGLAILPKVNEPVSFDELEPEGYTVCAYEKERKGSLRGLDLVGRECISLVVGPEGGFTDREAERLLTLGERVTLGSRILRAETAVISLVTLVTYLSGGMDI